MCDIYALAVIFGQSTEWKNWNNNDSNIFRLYYHGNEKWSYGIYYFIAKFSVRLIMLSVCNTLGTHVSAQATVSAQRWWIEYCVNRKWYWQLKRIPYPKEETKKMTKRIGIKGTNEARMRKQKLCAQNEHVSNMDDRMNDWADRRRNVRLSQREKIAVFFCIALLDLIFHSCCKFPTATVDSTKTTPKKEYRFILCFAWWCPT